MFLLLLLPFWYSHYTHVDVPNSVPHFSEVLYFYSFFFLFSLVCIISLNFSLTSLIFFLLFQIYRWATLVNFYFSYYLFQPRSFQFPLFFFYNIYLLIFFNLMQHCHTILYFNHGYFSSVKRFIMATLKIFYWFSSDIS